MTLTATHTLKRAAWLIILIIFVVNLSLCLFYRLFFQNHKQILIGGDAKGYYEYLPWAFKHKNINYDNAYSYEQNNSRVLKYSYGTALCQMPFYLVAQVFNRDTQNPEDLKFADSFFICLGASLYIALACGFLFLLFGKLSINRFSSIVAIASLYLGTNLLNYTVMEPFMSHVYSFFAITGFIYSVISFYQNSVRKYIIYAIVFLFLVIAIRPFNAIVVLPLMLFKFYQIRNWKLLAIYFVTIGIAYVIQLMCWRLQCGEWIFSSYRGEGFNWFDPQISNVLFSFRKGLFVYSPILILGLIGLLLSFNQNRSFKLSLLVVLGIFIYCIACWWHWPFGDSFGHRAFIDVYAIFAIGIAYLFETYKHKIIRSVFLMIAFVCVFLNLIQTWQYNHGILPAEYMTFEKYEYQFLYVDKASENNIGGINDIVSALTLKEAHQDSLSYINMNGKEYSPSVDFTPYRTNIGSFLTIDFNKIELLENASAKSKLYFQINDSTGKGYYFYSVLLNETPLDCESINNKKYSYQVKLPAIKPNEKLVFMFYNPERRIFILNKIKVNCYFILD